MTLEVALVCGTLLAISLAVVFGKTLATQAKALRELVSDLSRIVEDSNDVLATAFEASTQKALALSDAHREMFVAKIDAEAQEAKTEERWALSKEEQEIVRVYRSNRAAEQAILNPPPDPSVEVING